MKLKKSVLIPGILFIYLCVMAVLGYDDYQAGLTSSGEYYGILAISMIVIILLHFNIRWRDRIQQKREQKLNADNNNSKR